MIIYIGQICWDHDEGRKLRQETAEEFEDFIEKIDTFFLTKIIDDSTETDLDYARRQFSIGVAMCARKEDHWRQVLDCYQRARDAIDRVNARYGSANGGI